MFQNSVVCTASYLKCYEIVVKKHDLSNSEEVATVMWANIYKDTEILVCFTTACIMVLKNRKCGFECEMFM